MRSVAFVQILAVNLSIYTLRYEMLDRFGAKCMPASISDKNNTYN